MTCYFNGLNVVAYTSMPGIHNFAWSLKFIEWWYDLNKSTQTHKNFGTQKMKVTFRHLHSFYTFD